MIHRRFFKTLAIGAAMICMAAFLWPSMSCAAGKNDRKARAAQEEKSQQISRLELQNDLMRFAQVFIRGFRASLFPLVDGNDSTAVRFTLSDAELRGVNIVLTIVTGPDAVTNLLDLVIYVTMGRIYVEKNWDQSRLGRDRGGCPLF